MSAVIHDDPLAALSVDMTTAGKAFHMCAKTARARAKAGTFPCAVIKTGTNRYRVSTAELRRVLGLAELPTAKPA
jgi:hypothetical protein